MKLGIIGMSHSGKNTVFEALTRNFTSLKTSSKNRMGTIKIFDNRLVTLASLYNPKKTVPIQLNLFLPRSKGKKSFSGNLSSQLEKIKDCSALIHVLNNFQIYESEKLSLYKNYISMEQELILSDLMVVEKRLDRLIEDKKKGKPVKDTREFSLLSQCLGILNEGSPIRLRPDIATSKYLRGYSLLSAKPILTLINCNENMNNLPEDFLAEEKNYMIIKAKLEQELAQMSENEAKEFFSEFDISMTATNKIKTSLYYLLDLISFFTVGKDEVRAWLVKKGATALDAAEKIHSDIKKGFIKAELVAYDDLIKAGNYNKARKKGLVRLESKSYIVQDGDIMTFRFNI